MQKRLNKKKAFKDKSYIELFVNEIQDSFTILILVVDLQKKSLEKNFYLIKEIETNEKISMSKNFFKSNQKKNLYIKRCINKLICSFL